MNALCPPVADLPAAGRVDAALRRLLALDAEQLQVLELAGENTRVRVRGGAGTGKTIVARELCMRRASAGARVLYLCFTDALACALDRSFASARKAGLDVRATAIRRLARSTLARHECIDVPWDEISLRATRYAEPNSDLVVVDEAQDFGLGDWALVRAIVGDHDLWLFEDPDQQFWTDRNIPPDLVADLPVLTLARQQRMSAGIERLAARYAGRTIDPPNGWTLDPAEVRVFDIQRRDTLEVLTGVVESLLGVGVPPQHLAVLTLAGQTRSRILGERIGSTAVVRADDPAAPQSVVSDTFLRFKGLERAVVVLAELAVCGTRHRYETRMHIAITRATSTLIVLASQAALQADVRLSTLCTPMDRTRIKGRPR